MAGAAALVANLKKSETGENENRRDHILTSVPSLTLSEKLQLNDKRVFSLWGGGGFFPAPGRSQYRRSRPRA